MNLLRILILYVLCNKTIQSRRSMHMIGYFTLCFDNESREHIVTIWRNTSQCILTIILISLNSTHLDAKLSKIKYV